MRFLLFLIFIFPASLLAQEKDSVLKVIPTIHFRNFTMATFNQGQLRDDFALASTLRVGFKTNTYKRFSLTANYRVFAIHAFSQGVWEPEPNINQLNRYETGLFDLNRPEKRYFGKIEELNISYKGNFLNARLGRMIINTPFVNPQDGRLNPTAVEGVQIGGKVGSSLQLNSFHIWRMGLRSTGNWTSIGSSIGVYPLGLGEDGNRSQYRGVTQSDLISILHAHYKINRNQIHLWNTWVSNISNTAMVEWKGDLELSKGNNWVYATMVGYQQGIGNGGNSDPELRFKNPNDLHGFISLQSGFKKKHYTWALNYTHLSGKGRFLSPREWGRDPFYTFMPRERNEGYAFVNAATTFLEAILLKGILKPSLGYGFFFLPDASDASVNKYAFPSYRQLNASVKVHGIGKWENIDGMLLLVRKNAMQKEIDRLGWIYNKVNLSHVNVIVNYRF
jgi:hypothetical protein